MQKSKLTLAVIGALLATSAQAGSYVLQANKWGAAQEAAVAAAGGRVVYASAGAGIAVVDSDNADFASAMKASRTVTDVDADVVLNFEKPVVSEPVEASIANAAAETFGPIQWWLRAVQAPDAWAATGITGQGVRVAVVDGGVHAAHVDLREKVDLVRSRNFTVPSGSTAGGCTSAPGNWNCDTGTFWHGTHVSGIIAANASAPNQNVGTIGIAPNATIISVKALHNGSGSFGWVIAGILYAATPIAEDGAGADIINMSLGAETPRKQNAGLVAALNRAVNYATARGSLVVVAAGNSGYDMDKPPASVEVAPGVFEPLGPSTIVVPAESGNAIAISATGPLGFGLGATDYSRPASYSNYGNFIWLAAPGGDFALPGSAVCTYQRNNPTTTALQLCWVLDMVISTSRGSGASISSYSWAAGTSMAAPAVAGVAALIKQRFPNATPAQLKTKLAQSAVDLGKAGQDNFYGHGFVNALRAVTQ
jgi:subtilisin family serine protease